MKLVKNNVHKLWHSFVRYLEKRFGERIKLDKSTKKLYDKIGHKNDGYRTELNFNKIQGYNSMKYLNKYIKKHKEVVEIGVDDNCHAGSSIYLIPHESKESYMGTTILFVPQCSPENNLFFLYPNHLDNLIKELQKIQKKHKNSEDY